MEVTVLLTLFRALPSDRQREALEYAAQLLREPDDAPPGSPPDHQSTS